MHFIASSFVASSIFYFISPGCAITTVSQLIFWDMIFIKFFEVRMSTSYGTGVDAAVFHVLFEVFFAREFIHIFTARYVTHAIEICISKSFPYFLLWFFDWLWLWCLLNYRLWCLHNYRLWCLNNYRLWLIVYWLIIRSWNVYRVVILTTHFTFH